MALLGELSAFTFSGVNAVCHPSQRRQHTYAVFWRCGQKVCRKTFVFLHTISEKRLKNLKVSLARNGLSPRTPRNTRRLPANTISYADTQQVVRFVTTCAEAHAILLPGRIPGYKRTDFQLLPSSMTKRSVWLLYSASLETLTSPVHRVSYSTFCSLWKRFLPRVLAAKPMSDLCLVCQKNSIDIMRSANHPEEQKSEVCNLMAGTHILSLTSQL